MDLTAELAEISGTLIGDGCLCRFWANYDHRLRHLVVFTGSSDEITYYVNFVQPVIKNYFGARGRPFIRTYKGKKSTRYYITSQLVFDFFKELGIPVGKKSSTVFIPEPIFHDKELLRSCLRGMWDTDGSIYRVYSKIYKGQSRCYDKQLAMQYKTVSETLAFQMKAALEQFSIKTNKIGRNGTSFVIRITAQSEIQKFLDTIGFRNQHHLKRLASFRSTSV